MGKRNGARTRRELTAPLTPNKPDISVVDYQPGNTTSIFMNVRVADIQACYEDERLSISRGDLMITRPPRRLHAVLGATSQIARHRSEKIY
jgi:hypothetical protein